MSIWKFESLKQELPEATNFFTLGEGNTPLETFKDETNTIYLKREDKNPSGSWKDRGTAFKLTQLVSQGHAAAVISSSGNAGISFLQYSNELDLPFTMHVVISPSTNVEKKELLYLLASKGNHVIYEDRIAKVKATRIAVEKNIPLLKTAIDNDILKGYWTIGYELYKNILHDSKQTYLCLASSSATALVGIVTGLFNKFENESTMPKILISQTQSCAPIVTSILNRDIESLTKSKADAIVDKSLLRMPQVKKILQELDGDAFAITNKELENAKSFLLEHSIKNISYTSLLPVAAYLRKRNEIADSSFYLILSGR